MFLFDFAETSLTDWEYCLKRHRLLYFLHRLSKLSLFSSDHNDISHSQGILIVQDIYAAHKTPPFVDEKSFILELIKK